MEGFMVGVGVTILVGMFVVTPDAIWQSQAIERGYALYCPLDGEFSWKGECKDG
jgi:hypothetical protein